jgi:hypothetical protein
VYLMGGVDGMTICTLCDAYAKPPVVHTITLSFVFITIRLDVAAS